jgi:hypothetical protein
MRKFIPAFVLLLFAIAASLQALPVEKPNIVFLLSDDQDWTGLSVRMHPDIPNSKSDFYETPNLEKFAAQGMRFSATGFSGTSPVTLAAAARAVPCGRATGR